MALQSSQLSKPFHELINDYYAQKPDFSALTASSPNDKQEPESTTDTKATSALRI
jgi:hypothetical protein